MAEEGLDEARLGDAWPLARKEADSIMDEADHFGIRAVGWFDAEFPSRLRSIPDAPAVLFFRGAIEVASMEKMVAIVGTRDPTEWGRTAASKATRELAAQGWTIVSGLALGIDSIAHREALQARVPTVAILGNGLASVYPAANRTLAEEIVEAGGLLLAEVAPRASVDSRSLVKRDRLQSGLAHVTVICQGGRSSGAMHTARYAIDQERPLYVAAFSRAGEPLGPQDEGTQALLREPSRRLPELLPAWHRVSARRLNETPIARPLDSGSLANLDHEIVRAEDQSTLF
jgi:DNA processing protein